MSVFSDIIIQARTGDVTGAAQSIVTLSKGEITREQALQDAKAIEKLFKQLKRRKQNGHQTKTN